MGASRFEDDEGLSSEESSVIEQALKEAGIELEGLFALEAGTGAGETTEHLAEHALEK